MHSSEVVEYLCVDDFLTTLSAARTLKSGFELDVIDVIQATPVHLEHLQDQIECPTNSLRLLVQLLKTNNVLAETTEGLVLSEAFGQAMRFCDLLEAKLDFALAVAPDFSDLFTVLLKDTQEFLNKAKLFQLFDYEKCLSATEANYEATRRWMRFTTALTRYEAPVCLSYHDFSSYRRMLDIGGNSGEFSRQICCRNLDLIATVCDLPVVCDIGQQHLADTEEADRIDFFRANALHDPLPDGYDVITFKSMLHDWPDEQAITFLQKAHHSVKQGGSLLIYERGPLDFTNSELPFSLLPILLFFPFYRSPEFYQQQFQHLGMVNIEIHEFFLESPFFVVSGTKP